MKKAQISNTSRLSEALLCIRRFHDISQKDLAEKLDLSQSFICDLESGKRYLSLETLEKYSRFFSVPKSSLFFLAELLEARVFPALPEIKIDKKIALIIKGIALKRS